MESSVSNAPLLPLSFHCRSARLCMKKAAFAKKARLASDELAHLKKFYMLLTSTIASHPQFEAQRTEKQLAELLTCLPEARKRMQQLEGEAFSSPTNNSCGSSALTASKPAASTAVMASKDGSGVKNPKLAAKASTRALRRGARPLPLPGFCADDDPQQALAPSPQAVLVRSPDQMLQKQRRLWGNNKGIMREPASMASSRKQRKRQVHLMESLSSQELKALSNVLDIDTMNEHSNDDRVCLMMDREPASSSNRRRKSAHFMIDDDALGSCRWNRNEEESEEEEAAAGASCDPMIEAHRQHRPRLSTNPRPRHGAPDSEECSLQKG